MSRVLEHLIRFLSILSFPMILLKYKLPLKYPVILFWTEIHFILSSTEAIFSHIDSILVKLFLGTFNEIDFLFLNNQTNKLRIALEICETLPVKSNGFMYLSGVNMFNFL
jgi:hypothetical protein